MIPAPAAADAVLTDRAMWHLLARIELVGSQVAVAVARRRAIDDGEDENFRGLYVSDAHVDALLTGRTPRPPGDDVVAELVDDVERAADAMEADGVELPLRQLARACGLDAIDVELLLIAVAPEVEPVFQPLYAYLLDDVTRRRAGAALALELACGPAAPLSARWRLGPSGTLVARHLVEVEDGDAPFSTRSLAVPNRVVGHLLGDATPDALVASMTCAPAAVPVDLDTELARAVAGGSPLLYVRDEEGWGVAACVRACAENSTAPLVVDLSLIDREEDESTVAAAVALETLLSERPLVAGPVEALASRPSLLRALGRAAGQVVLVGSRAWDSAWSDQAPVVLTASVAAAAERADAWRSAIGTDVGFDAGAATTQFRLGPDEIYAAARTAVARSTLAGRGVSIADLHHAARQQTSSALERLARRIEPRASWHDLVVTDAVENALRHLAARARYRELVLTKWGLGAGASRRRGIVALLAGPSGTGKTMSAEVVASELGLDLYVIDLASVVDKYVGETEKNLERIFDEAARVNGVLLFDEADALFGKRSGVENAHDRFANIEVAYLLQRIESFDGIAILTSNLRGNLDEAFARRLDAVIELPMPDEAARLRLWEANLPPALPRGEDLDLEFLTRFELSGGNVRNACVAAAFRAAATGRAVTMDDLVRGVAQEYTKLGRMCVDSEFGRYHDLVARA